MAMEVPLRIGVFDSGIGGLTVLRALRDELPQHDYLYLGDTARIPYGSRAPVTVVRYALAVASYLFEQGAEALVIACNTATAHALPAIQQAAAQHGIPVFGVINPGVTAALEAHQSGAVAVLGTSGTIAGGAYQSRLRALKPNLELYAVPCPLFVPLVEEGWLDGEVPEQVAAKYVGHLSGVADTVILGCTHYPLLKPVLSRVLPGVTLVDSAAATATVVRDALGLGHGPGSVHYMVTDHAERFSRVGATFLGRTPEDVTWVDLPPPVPSFASFRPPSPTDP